MQNYFRIGGHDPEAYGAKLQQDYTIGGTAVTNTIFQGRNRTHYTLLAGVFGRKPITFTLTYQGRTERACALLRSQVESWMWGKVELYMPTGFWYTSTLTSIGDATREGVDGVQVLMHVQYSFEGIQHDPLITVAGESFENPGTLARSDCLVETTVSAAASTYQLAGATFQNVTAGEKLTVDGINGRLLRNGAPATGNVTFVRFPYVVPGHNSLTALDPVTVQFYPCYI
ncbi:MAG: hypothetical protein DBX91_14050 [Subdoligranulum variabile]|uniref:hypothetical protein n=1 Tax=Gemmiger formicilis TaxID=745368 RepID=UPI000D79EF15|nr:MAG: hypothetical protein DBX91_14050 [Subdoligranulum variabile]